MPESALDTVGAVKPAIRQIAADILHAAEAAGHRINTIYGYNPASKPEHSAGLALDFMCDRPGGDWIADHIWTHRDEFGLRWEIWRQRIRSTSPGKPSTWQPMADRGDPTQNHMDHVHAFFTGSTPPVIPPVRGEAARPWWGDRPHPQQPAYLSIANLRAAMEHDAPSPGQDLYWYADQVWALQRLLSDTGWLRYGSYVAGHYGTYTIGRADNPDDGGVKGFQAKRGWTSSPDGWVGRRELQWLMDTAGRHYEVCD